MIKLLPCCEGSHSRGLIVICNVYYTEDHSDVFVSLPPKYVYSRKLSDGNYLVLSEGNAYSYDTLNFEFTKIIYKDEISRFLHLNPERKFGSQVLSDKKDKSRKTKIFDRSGQEIYTLSDISMKVALETKDYYIHSGREKVCVSNKTKSVVWRKKYQGDLLNYNFGDLLYFYRRDLDTNEVFINKLDINTGEEVNSNHLVDFRALTIRKVKESDQIVWVGHRKDGGPDEIIDYNFQSDTYTSIPIQRKAGLPPGVSIAHLSKNYIYYYLHHQEAYVKDQGPAFINRYRLDTGDYAGQVTLPEGITIVTYNSYFKIGDFEGCFAFTRGGKTGSLRYLVLWEESDFQTETQAEIQSVTSQSERLLEDDQSYYRVSHDISDCGIFQLVCQLSAKLYQVGAEVGYSLVDEEKEYDEDFNGRLICDVSNLSLSKKQQLAIKHMCARVEEELKISHIKSSYDPAEKIEIEVVI